MWTLHPSAEVLNTINNIFDVVSPAQINSAFKAYRPREHRDPKENVLQVCV